MPITSTTNLILQGKQKASGTFLTYSTDNKSTVNIIRSSSISNNTKLAQYQTSINTTNNLLIYSTQISNSHPLNIYATDHLTSTLINLFKVDLQAITWMQQHVGTLPYWLNPNKLSILLLQEKTFEKFTDNIALELRNTRRDLIQPISITYSGGLTNNTSLILEDVTGPRLINLIPASGSTYNNPETNISFDINDQEGNSVVLASIFMYVNGVEVIASGINVAPPLFGSAIVNMVTPSKYHFNFDAQNPFSPDSPIVVSGTAIDNNIPYNSSTFLYSFRVWNTNDLGATITALPDTDSPTLINQSPYNGEVQVVQNRNINFDLVDYATGLNINSVQISLDNLPIVSGINNLSPDTISLTTSSLMNGIRYSINPITDFEFNSIVSVKVYAEDRAYPTPNVLDTSYSFVTYDNSYLSASGLQINTVGGYVDCDRNISYPVSTTGNEFKINYINLYGTGINASTSYVECNNTIIPTTFVSISGANEYEVYFNLEPTYVTDSRLVFHVEDLVTNAGVPIYREFNTKLLWGYEVCYDQYAKFLNDRKIPVVMQVYDRGYHSQQSSTVYSFDTEPLKHKDLLAEIIGKKYFDGSLLGNIISNNPYFEYGKDMELELEASDFAGNILKYKWKFHIKEKE